MSSRSVLGALAVLDMGVQAAVPHSGAWQLLRGVPVAQAMSFLRAAAVGLAPVGSGFHGMVTQGGITLVALRSVGQLRDRGEAMVSVGAETKVRTGKTGTF
jgi:hypothetical protein